MTKGLNSNWDTPGKDFSLPRAKILRGKKKFQHLFEGDATLFFARKVHLRFRLFPKADQEYLMAFIVKKKLGKAAGRNRVKRLLKEAYRLNQHMLSDSITQTTLSFHGALMANTLEVSFDEVQEDVQELLRRVQDYLPSTTDNPL